MAPKAVPTGAAGGCEVEGPAARTRARAVAGGGGGGGGGRGGGAAGATPALSAPAWRRADGAGRAVAAGGDVRLSCATDV